MQGNSSQEGWTLLRLLNWTTGYFRRAGIENPRLNAEVLLAAVANVQRIMLYARFDEELAAEKRARFRELVRRRAEGEPVQYLLGRAEFYGRTFRVTPAALIPRPETELLVNVCLEKLPEEASGMWAADIGTGCGAIAVTLACERPGLRLAATDSSPDALELARENARRHGVADRILFGQGHLCEALPAELASGDWPLALVASNPPYIPSAQIEELQREVRDHEPRAALDGGPDGLRVIRELIPAAARVLSPGGWLVLELGEGQAEPVRKQVAATPSLEPQRVEIVRDGRCERILAVRKAQRRPPDTADSGGGQ